MNLAAIDLETLRILPGCAAPPVVCGAWVGDGVPAGIALAPHDQARALLADPTRTVVAANAPFDLACLASERPDLLSAIFDALRAGRVYDPLVAQALDAIYCGTLGVDPRTGGPLRKPSTGEETKRYSLEVVCDLVLGRVDAKDRAAYRTSYGIFRGIPVDRWPREAREYPLDDVRNPLDVARAQICGQPGRHRLRPIPRLPGDARPGDDLNDIACEHCGEVVAGVDLVGARLMLHEPCPKAPPRPPHRNLSNLVAQVEAAFALHLGRCWSLRTDPEKVEALAAEVEEKHRQAVARFQVQGWIRPDGSEDQAAVKRAVALAYGATGTCARCGGSGRVRPRKVKPCRGQKTRGRYPGCPGAACAVCGGSGEVAYLGDERTCQAGETEARCPLCAEPQYAHPAGGATCTRGHRATSPNPVPGCDGTGLDLRTAPAIKRTKGGGIATDRDTKMESGDDDLAEYGEDEFEKSRSTYVPYLRTGVARPLDYSPNVLVASGRCSYEGSPLHQMPRDGRERECIRARGAWCGSPVEYVLGSTDYEAGELVTLSWVLRQVLGYSRMYDAIVASGKPGVLHSDLAAQVLGIPLGEFLARLAAKDEQAKNFRQASKPYMFGRPGRMGSARIALSAREKKSGFTDCEGGPSTHPRTGRRGYWGIRFCVLMTGARRCGAEKVTEWKKHAYPPICRACLDLVENVIGRAYDRRYPEIRESFAWADRIIERGDGLSPTILWDREAGRPRVVRQRGGCDGPAFSNNLFQSPLSDIGKLAVCRMTREMYLGERWDGSGPSPLGGCRMPLFAHDEPITELILATAHVSGPRIGEIMVEAGSELMPGIPWRAETALAYWFSKAMEPKYRDGKLVPWDQEKMDAWREGHPEIGRRMAA